MQSGKFVFSQVLACVQHWEFQRLAQRHGIDSGRLRFSAWEHFLAMAFAQLTYRASLRDIEACLGTQPTLAYHLGFRHPVRRSTLAYANEHRDWRLFAALGQRLMHRARRRRDDDRPELGALSVGELDRLCRRGEAPDDARSARTPARVDHHHAR
jgi:hypothetical protein